MVDVQRERIAAHQEFIKELQAENLRLREALKACDGAFFTIIANTEPEAIKCDTYERLARHMCETASPMLPLIREALGIPPKAGKR